MALSTAEKWFYELAMFLPIYRLRKNVSRKLANLENVIDNIRKYSDEAGNLGENNLRDNYSRMLYVLLFDYDIALQLFDSVREFDSRRKNYRVRQLCLLLHEGFESIPVVLGQAFRKLIVELPNGLTHLEKLDLVLGAISKLRKAHRKLLKKVRDEVAAHREHDALRQLEVQQQIPLGDIEGLAMAFDLQLAELSELLLPIVHELGVHSIRLKQLQICNQKI